MRGVGEGRRHHRAQAVEAEAGGQQVVAVAVVAAAFGREHRGLRGAALWTAGAGAEQQGEGNGGGGARRNSDHAATVASSRVWNIVLWYHCATTRLRTGSCA